MPLHCATSVCHVRRIATMLIVIIFNRPCYKKLFGTKRMKSLQHIPHLSCLSWSCESSRCVSGRAASPLDAARPQRQLRCTKKTTRKKSNNWFAEHILYLLCRLAGYCGSSLFGSGWWSSPLRCCSSTSSTALCHKKRVGIKILSLDHVSPL